MKLLVKIFLGIVVLAIGGVASVFYLTSGMTEEAESFFAAVREGDTATTLLSQA